MLYEAQTDARERQTKEVGEKRKRQASWWDYVFMIVLRPISEMGAVPRIFSRPPSMACPHLVKSGSCWMDTQNWKTADLQQRFSTIVQPYWGCCSMGAFVFTWCASLMSVFPGGEGRGVYSHLVLTMQLFIYNMCRRVFDTLVHSITHKIKSTGSNVGRLMPTTRTTRMQGCWKKTDLVPD